VGERKQKAVRLIDRQPIDGAEIETFDVVTMICRSAEEAHVRALLLQEFATDDLQMKELESSNTEDTSGGEHQDHS
jgi:putative Mg2+ transporter-C (MgtC) family protein